MGLFRGTMTRDSVSLLRFLSLSHVQVFLCEISLVCIKKFSSHFCFLVIILVLFVLFVLTPVGVISLFYVDFETYYWYIVAIFNAEESSSSFFSWHLLCLSIMSGKEGFYNNNNNNNNNNNDHHYYYYYLLIIVFHISVSWWSFTGIWVTASLQDTSQFSGRSQ